MKLRNRIKSEIMYKILRLRFFLSQANKLDYEEKRLPSFGEVGQVAGCVRERERAPVCPLLGQSARFIKNK